MLHLRPDADHALRLAQPTATDHVEAWRPRTRIAQLAEALLRLALLDPAIRPRRARRRRSGILAHALARLGLATDLVFLLGALALFLLGLPGGGRFAIGLLALFALGALARLFLGTARSICSRDFASVRAR